MNMDSPASALNDEDQQSAVPDSRTCPHCSKIFQGLKMAGFGRHRASCKKSGSNAAGAVSRIKEHNCCCKVKFSTREQLREHQGLCGVFKFKVEETTNRGLYNDPLSIASEALHLSLDHAEHGEEEGEGESGHQHAEDGGCNGCDLTYANLQDRIKAAKRLPLTPAMRYELWVAQFCLKRSLSLLDGKEMVEQRNEELDESKKTKEYKSQTYRRILENIKFNRRYPDIRGYRWDQELEIDVPAGMNGAAASKVTFKYADATAVLSSMLLEKRLHGNKKENISWDPKHVVVKETGERFYDADVFSGDWAFRTKKEIPVGKDLLAVSVYSDATNVTGSGKHSAHPIFIQIANFTEEVRNKDGSYRPIALLPRLNPIESMKDSKEFSAFKLQMFHTCVEAALKPLKEMNEKGGWRLKVMGEDRVLIPAISFFSQDSPEVSFVTALFIFVHLN